MNYTWIPLISYDHMMSVLRLLAKSHETDRFQLHKIFFKIMNGDVVNMFFSLNYSKYKNFTYNVLKMNCSWIDSCYTYGHQNYNGKINTIFNTIRKKNNFHYSRNINRKIFFERKSKMFDPQNNIQIYLGYAKKS